MALAREWDQLLKEARRREGENFLRPLPLETLQPAAEHGPLVVLNVSRWRCDALLVTADEVIARPLPDLTIHDAADQVNRYLTTLRAAEKAADIQYAARERLLTSGTMGERQAAQRAEIALHQAREATEKMLTGFLAWLWDVIAQPVLYVLDYRDTPPPDAPVPQLWWCPTGPLTLLPLHAARHHQVAPDGPARTVIDRVVSSYTPTIRALLEARRPIKLPPESERDLLIVAASAPPGERPLRSVAHELELLCGLFPEACRTVLTGASANREAVRRALAAHRWAHFSCHGDQNLTDPSRGGLVLHDGMPSAVRLERPAADSPDAAARIWLHLLRRGRKWRQDDCPVGKLIREV
jgi:hypothetical protein